MKLRDLERYFIERYGTSSDPATTYFAPGRVNLIGEHTDYNGGYVFPCALTLGTYLVVRRTNDNRIKLVSTNLDFAKEVFPDEISAMDRGNWVDYPCGVIEQFIKNGTEMSGLELLFSGDLPLAAGLSSSASIEMVTAVALNELYDCGLEKIELAKLCQRAEQEYVGVKCGIMDQFTSAVGQKDHAILLNCQSLEFELLNLKLSGYKLILANTNKPRQLTSSAYNDRRTECERVLSYIQKAKPVNSLCELSHEEFLEMENSIPEEPLRKRARHAIDENMRALDAAKAVQNGDLHLFGRLMNESHDSLQDLYEITGPELDALVEEARLIDGVLGSRMTGAGMGGCTLNLLKDHCYDSFCESVGAGYHQKTGLVAEFYEVVIGDGARKVDQ